MRKQKPSGTWLLPVTAVFGFSLLLCSSAKTLQAENQNTKFSSDVGKDAGEASVHSRGLHAPYRSFRAQREALKSAKERDLSRRAPFLFPTQEEPPPFVSMMETGLVRASPIPPQTPQRNSPTRTAVKSPMASEKDAASERANDSEGVAAVSFLQRRAEMSPPQGFPWGNVPPAPQAQPPPPQFMQQQQTQTQTQQIQPQADPMGPPGQPQPLPNQQASLQAGPQGQQAGGMQASWAAPTGTFFAPPGMSMTQTASEVPPGGEERYQAVLSRMYQRRRSPFQLDDRNALAKAVMAAQELHKSLDYSLNSFRNTQALLQSALTSAESQLEAGDRYQAAAEKIVTDAGQSLQAAVEEAKSQQKAASSYRGAPVQSPSSVFQSDSSTAEGTPTSWLSTGEIKEALRPLVFVPEGASLQMKVFSIPPWSPHPDVEVVDHSNQQVRALPQPGPSFIVVEKTNEASSTAPSAGAGGGQVYVCSRDGAPASLVCDRAHSRMPSLPVEVQTDKDSGKPVLWTNDKDFAWLEPVHLF